jgi:hypothetical protein
MTNLGMSPDSVLGEGPATEVTLDQDLTLRWRVSIDVRPSSFSQSGLKLLASTATHPQRLKGHKIRIQCGVRFYGQSEN